VIKLPIWKKQIAYTDLLEVCNRAGGPGKVVSLARLKKIIAQVINDSGQIRVSNTLKSMATFGLTHETVKGWVIDGEEAPVDPYATTK
jgi:hypothetical protein